MTDWTNPETLTTDELVGFLRNEHETHGVGWGYAGGTSVVGGVYKEAARRLVKAEAALKQVMEFDALFGDLDEFDYCECKFCDVGDSECWRGKAMRMRRIIQNARRIYNGGTK